MAAGVVLNGTCNRFTPAICLNISPAKCWVAAKPGLANTTLLGSALATATSSFTLLGGKSGRGFRDHIVSYDAAGAGLVFDDHRLAELGLHRFRQYAADDVGAAAGPERNHDADILVGPFLRGGGLGQ